MKSLGAKLLLELRKIGARSTQRCRYAGSDLPSLTTSYRRLREASVRCAMVLIVDCLRALAALRARRLGFLAGLLVSIGSSPKTMRTSTRPRPPDEDCVFISDGRIVARANAPSIAADMARLGFTPRCVLAHIAFSVSKL